MDPFYDRIIAIVVVVLICFTILVYIDRTKFKRYLSGYWTGNYEYMKTAGLTSFELLFNNSLTTCYVQMSNEENTIFSDIVDTSICVPYTTYGFARTCPIEVKICITFDEKNLPFKNKLTGKLSILNGTLKLYDGEELAGFFEKDHTLVY
jgi:hypothetical protein